MLTDGDSPFASPFGAGGPFGFGERPLRTQGLSRFGVRTDLEDLDVDGQLNEREGSRPGRATWMLHQAKVVQNGRGVANYTAIMDNLRVGDRIGALVDGRNLTFYLNGKSQGVATNGLPSDSRTLHFVLDMQGTVDSFRVLPERTVPKTQEELEMGTLAGIVKGDSLTKEMLAAKIKSDAAQAATVDQDGRTALHYLCRDHPEATAEMISMLAQANTSACMLQDRSGKTPLLYLLEDGTARKTVLDFATESEYGEYLIPLCRAGGKLQATKNLSSRVRQGMVGEYVSSNKERGVQVNWEESGQKRWESWSHVVLAKDEATTSDPAPAGGVGARAVVSLEMVGALVGADEKCVTVAGNDGTLPVQLAERGGAGDEVCDELVKLSLSNGLVWCGGRTALGGEQYGIHVLLTSASGAPVAGPGSSTLQKMAVNGAHRSATQLHGLPFSADDVKMTVCGPTHLAFLLKSGAVFRLASKAAAGDELANQQVSAGEQRLEGVRAQLSARRMRVKHIEAQVRMGLLLAACCLLLSTGQLGTDLANSFNLFVPGLFRREQGLPGPGG